MIKTFFLVSLAVAVALAFFMVVLQKVRFKADHEPSCNSSCKSCSGNCCSD